ncbi:MAG: hypothetical protein ACRENA_08765 [Vulcanimicrobiaceae bacterium]
MQKLSFFASLCLLLTASWAQPAYAQTVEVRNHAPEPIVVSVLYFSGPCRGDHNIKIAVGGSFSNRVGTCAVEEIFVTLQANGRGRSCIWKSNSLSDRLGQRGSFVVLPEKNGGCHVRRA